MSSSKKRKKDIHKKKRHPNPDKRAKLVDGLTEHVKKQAVVHEVGEKTPHKHSVPDLIMEFIKDELEARTEQDEQREIINAGITCWNMGSFGEPADMEKNLIETVKKVGADERLEQTMRKLLQRKVTDYNEYKYFITDYEIKRTVTGTWDLTIASFDFTALAAMKEARKN